MIAIMLFTLLFAEPQLQDVQLQDASVHRLYDVEVKMLEALNGERVKRGLYTLTIDDNLQTGCREWCAHMAEVSRMYHAHGRFSENIAMGQKDVATVTQTWIQSPGHRRNMLGNYTKCGVAGYVNSRGQIFWVQRFR